MGSNKPKRPLEGLVWPQVPGKEGDRSTTYANKAALKTACDATDSALAQKIERERKWRQNYGKYIIEHVKSSLVVEGGAVKSAEAGLSWMHDNFEFVKDGNTMPFSQAMSTIKDSFKTGVIKGTKPKPSSPPPLKVPYKGGVLEGEALMKQIDKWVSYGTIEASAGDAIRAVAQNSEWRDLSDKYFVLLGAGSAMGPLHILMELGANVIAIDLDRPGIWKKLIGIAKNSSGTMTFPMKEDQGGMSSEDALYEAAGCNLMTQTPQILNWLKTVQPGKSLVVGCYAYLDGELHVRLSVAMDAIVKGLTETKDRPSVMPAYLCTPTDVHCITPEAAAAAKANYSPFSSVFSLMLRTCPLFWFGPLAKNFGRKLQAQGPGGETFYLVDGLVNRQGPNYALAKRLQHWRAIVSRERYGCPVSSNIAPSTATASVTSNKLFAMAYGGMHWFQPMEVFQQETSNAVMGAILLHDVNVDKAIGVSPDVKLASPLQLFSYGSFHGGVWRMGFKVDSVGEVSILMYAGTIWLKWLLILATVFVVAAAFGHDPIGLKMKASALGVEL